MSARDRTLSVAARNEVRPFLIAMLALALIMACSSSDEEEESSQSEIEVSETRVSSVVTESTPSSPVVSNGETSPSPSASETSVSSIPSVEPGGITTLSVFLLAPGEARHRMEIVDESGDFLAGVSRVPRLGTGAAKGLVPEPLPENAAAIVLFRDGSEGEEVARWEIPAHETGSRLRFVAELSADRTCRELIDLTPGPDVGLRLIAGACGLAEVWVEVDGEGDRARLDPESPVVQGREAEAGNDRRWLLFATEEAPLPVRAFSASVEGEAEVLLLQVEDLLTPGRASAWSFAEGSDHRREEVTFEGTSLRVVNWLPDALLAVSIDGLAELGTELDFASVVPEEPLLVSDSVEVRIEVTRGDQVDLVTHALEAQRGWSHLLVLLADQEGVLEVLDLDHDQNALAPLLENGFSAFRTLHSGAAHGLPLDIWSGGPGARPQDTSQFLVYRLLALAISEWSIVRPDRLASFSMSISERPEVATPCTLGAPHGVRPGERVHLLIHANSTFSDLRFRSIPNVGQPWRTSCGSR